MAYDNNNSGDAFHNDKTYSANSPDFRGTLDVEGTEYWVSVWVKTAGAGAKNPGAKFLSLSLTAKDEAKAPAPTASTADPLAGYGDMVNKPQQGDKPSVNENAGMPPMPKLPDSVAGEDDIPF